MAAAADDIRHELLYGDRLLPCYAQRPRNLDDMLRRSVALGDGRGALEDEDARLTYASWTAWRSARPMRCRQMASQLVSGWLCSLATGWSSSPCCSASGVGTLRALGTSVTSRPSVVKDVPTLIEAGVPGYAFNGWVGMWGPAGTPPEIVNRPQVARR